MILNIFKKFHEDSVEEQQELVASYDEDIRNSEMLQATLESPGYSIIKEVFHKLIEEYQAKAFDDSQDYEKGKILIAKAAALKEVEAEIASVIRLGYEAVQKQKEIIESL